MAPAPQAGVTMAGFAAYLGSFHLLLLPGWHPNLLMAFQPGSAQGKGLC